MTRQPVEDAPRLPRGATSPWRGPDYRPRPGRAISTLAAGPPSERAVATFVRLAGLAKPPAGRRRRHPEIAKVPLAMIAAALDLPPRTTKRRLAELRHHGWIVASRPLCKTAHGGRLRGLLHVELVWPLDLLNVLVGPVGPHSGGGLNGDR